MNRQKFDNRQVIDTRTVSPKTDKSLCKWLIKNKTDAILIVENCYSFSVLKLPTKYAAKFGMTKKELKIIKYLHTNKYIVVRKRLLSILLVILGTF